MRPSAQQDHAVQPSPGSCRHVEAAQNQVLGNPLALRLGHRPVELDQDLPGRDAIAVAHVNGRDDAGLERLDGLGPAGRHDLALGGGDNVGMAEAGPSDRDGKEQDDRCADRASDG
jgi:hypothetical protein